MNKLLTFLFSISAICANGADFVKDGNFVTVDLANKSKVSKVRLQVVNEDIIRVEATKESAFPKKQSLIIVPQTKFEDFTVSQTGSDVAIKTKNVCAHVDANSGRVSFLDSKGNVILSEAADGKTLTPYRVPTRDIGLRQVDDDPEKLLSDAQRNGWSWQLMFDSPADEAFYGLGQHQAEEYNYKGKNEELFQYNTKVSVPFVMSNRGYGLLWDSYSLGRWGNPSPYMQLGQVFKLYDKNGKAGHLTGTYTEKSGKKLVREEDSLYFEDLFELKNLPQIALDSSHVLYEGSLVAPETATYNFILYYAGYTKIYIDGKEVVPERWRTAWNPNSYKFQVKLEKGKKTSLKIDWLPDGGQSYCGLRVANPKTAIPDDKISIWAEMDRDMDYYFIAGNTMDDIISGYRTLTGKASIYPKWSLGFWQSRERYGSSKDIEDNMSEFRKRHIPVDVIVQDWFYWKEDSWGSHAFDPQRYPNPQAMLDSVHQMHGRFMISVWPKFYKTTDNFKELSSHGWMYNQAVHDSIRDWVGPGYIAGFYDAYAPGARKMFWRQMDENLYSKYNKGIDAWWMDASEPNVRDCTPIWYRKALCGPTHLGSSTEYFNAYSIVNADAIYNGQRGVNPNTRVFLLTRSGFAGEQRYSTATWSGDIGTRWEDMRAQVTAGLNYSMCGLPFWGMDQGGFCVERRYEAAQMLFNAKGIENEDLKEWRELQSRWSQLGCFVPLFRIHGQSPAREIWNVAPDNHPAYKSFVYYDNLRYYMMPYLYSLAGWVHFNDYTMLRGLVMDFGSDSKVLNIGNQWMLGPSIMACPVMEYKARSRKVYLPSQCGWYDLYTGKHFNGGQTITADAPYEKIPVYIKEGAIIPFGPKMEWSDEKPADVINLYVYAGKDGKFQLYEDEGTNYNYEKGKYATIDISYDDVAKKVTFSDRQGSFDGMLQTRQFNIVYITPQNVKSLNLDNPQGKTVTYDGTATTVNL